MTKGDVEDILLRLAEENPEAIRLDGLDEAIIGIGGQYTKPSLLVYSMETIIGIFQDQGMTWEEAVEYFEFNVECLWAGEGTPIIVSLEG